jgi:hypothetical protein
MFFWFLEKIFVYLYKKNMSKHFITITDENLYNDIVEYCKLNGEKINNFCQRIIKEQLLIVKYGDTPFGEVTHEFELPPVVPIDAKDIIKPHINNMVEDYTKTINDRIIKQIVEPPIDTVQMPYELDEVTETITNGDISEKYKDKKVPKEFYGEIKVEEPKRKKIRRL